MMKKKVTDVHDAHLARRDEGAQRVLLGLDDGTEEAALAETLDFDRFVDEIDENHARRVSQLNDARGERPMLEEQRRHRERYFGHRVSFARSRRGR